MKNRDRLPSFILIPIILWTAIIFGYGRCVYKMATCNWEPVGKAEAFYTIGTFTGLGCIFGYINIEDK
jgi:hypothetical protein